MNRVCPQFAVTGDLGLHESDRTMPNGAGEDRLEACFALFVSLILTRVYECHEINSATDSGHDMRKEAAIVKAHLLRTM